MIILLFVLHGQALVILAEEITKSVIPEGSRKINGKYIQSHLLSRLKGMIMFLSLLQLTDSSTLNQVLSISLGASLYDGYKMHACVCLYCKVLRNSSLVNPLYYRDLQKNFQSYLIMKGSQIGLD